MADPIQRVSLLSYRNGVIASGSRIIPEETAVSLVYNGGTCAVMMASPSDLEDFAIGFSLTEGIIARADELDDLEIVEHPQGIELRLWLKQHRAEALSARRRQLAGPTGCGLCGIDSLREATRHPRRIKTNGVFSPKTLCDALKALASAQAMNQQTRSVHAAGFWAPGAGLVAIREDVGRHNALDKLVGVLHRSNAKPDAGLLLLTSRVSIEMVQKACVFGAPVLAAVSAPTALALRVADEAGLTLIGIARDDGFDVFTHPHRISTKALSDVA